MRTRLASIPALLVLTAAVVGGCSSDGDQVADEVDKQVAEALEVDTSDVGTACPDDAEAGDGNEFDCDIEIEDQTISASVTFTSDDEFTFVINGDAFDKEELEGLLKEQLAEGLDAEITELDCGGDTLVLIPAEDTIDCEGTDADGGSGTAQVGLDEDGAPYIVDVTS